MSVTRLGSHNGEGRCEELENGSRFFEGLRSCANDDEQVALASPYRAAGERRIDQLDTVFRKPFDRRRYGIRTDSAGEKNDASCGERRGDTVRAKKCVIELFTVADGDQQNVRALGRVTGGVETLHPLLGREGHSLSVKVERTHAQRTGKTGRHGKAHGTEAQDGDNG